MSALFTGVKPLRACRTRIHVFSARAGRVGGLLLAALLASLPLPAVAQTQGVSISVSPEAVGRYSSINEGQTATFTVSRTGDNSNALEMTYTASGGGGPANRHYENAVEGEDYTDIPESHTFPAGSSATDEFTVTIIDDDRYEPEQYFTLTVKGSYQDEGSTIHISDEVIVRIRENDERFLTLSPVSESALVDHPEFMAREGGTGNDNQLTISLNAPLPYDLDIGYTVGDDPYTTASAKASTTDFTMSDGIAKIEGGDTSVMINIGIIEDNRVEPTEYFTLDFKAPTHEDPGNALGTFNPVTFQDSKLPSQPLSVSIMDNDTASMGGIVYLRGEGPSGHSVIDKFPSTRRTITEGQSTIITAEIAGAAPANDTQIPLKVIGFPSNEVTPADYSIPSSITIEAGKKSGEVTLTITNDTEDERYRELLVVEIDDAGNFPTGYTKGDRSKYEVIMLDNDKTPTNLTGPTLTALTEDRNGTTMATFQLSIDRRPKADPTEDPPFTGADTKEVDAKLVLGYTGKATRGTDYKLTPNNLSSNSGIVIRKSPAAPPDGCSLDGEVVTCTVTLTVQDDNLYEGGVNTKENVKIDLDTGKSSFSGGIKKPTGLSLTIEDNDPQPMFSIADVSGPENGNLTFTVKREGARGNNVSVTAGTGSHSGATNSAIADTDYTTESQKLDFGRDNTTQTFEVAITDDNIDEPDKETFAVTLSNPVDNQGLPKPAIAAGKGTAVGTIEDNDDTPTELTISVNTGDKTDYNLDTIAEAAGKTTVSVTATIDSPTRFATDQTVTVTVGNDENEGEARKGDSGDYEAVDELTITIPATEASGKGTFDLTPVNDDIDDDGEMISVEGALAGMTVTHATITIVDDDTRGITVVSGEMDINEADDTSTSPQIENTSSYGVKLTSQPEGGTVTVNVAIKDATVAKVNTSSLVFDAQNWEHTQLVIVTAQDDTIDNTGDKRTTTITHTVSAAGTDYADETVEDVVTVTVRDDDEAPTALTIALDTDTSTEDIQSKVREGVSSPTVRITATLDGDTQFATDQTIAIIVGDSDKDTATEGEGGDYASVDEFHITLLAGDPSVSHDLTLTLNDDSVDEPDETVTVAGELAGVTVTDTMFAIEDNDDTPTVTLVLTPASINESGETNASTATATMDGTSSEAVTLTVSATSVSPAVASDFTLSDNKTLAIPANTQDSNGVVTITAVDNDVDAADKTVTVAATATGGNALVQAPGNQTLTITDDDTRGITVSKATLTLDEEDNTATMEAVEHQDTYTVVLDSEPSGGTVTIGVASDDANIARVAPATLTFTASNWDETQTVTVTAVLDGIDNPNDRRTAAITHTVTATGTDYDGATASGVTVTVNDDDGAPTLSINSPSVTEVDSGAAATLTFTVQLLPKSGNTVTVAYADAGTGTANSGGTDYATLVGGTLTFNPDDTSKPVAVTVSGDDIDELDETVVVRLSSPSNATLPGGATTLDGTGTITDNDPTPTVSVADAMAVSEGNVASPDPANNITFAVTLSAISGLEVTVPYTLSGTATAGTDYTEPDPRSVTIAEGETQVNIAIPVAGDEVDEENETITVTLGEPTNATVSTVEGAGTGSGTITDDDTRGVSVTPTALTVEEADDTNTATTREDQETYKVVLTSQPTGAVTVNLNSGDESVARIDTASLVFDADDWNTERTVTVTGQADVIDNKDDQRTTNITHTVSAAVTDYEDETAKSVAVTVTDDDAAPSGITLTASPDSVTENGGGKTITVTAAVNDATRYADAKTVTVSVGGGTAISGTDYSVVESFDITIGAGEDDASNTFTLTPTNDVLAEGNETIDVTGTLSGITITPDAITLTDDDAAPTGITLSVDTNGAEDGTPSTVAEDAGATVVTVTATVNGTTRYVDAKTVVVSVADGTAASPADYAAVSDFSITIAAGGASQSGSFTVTPVDDDLDESNETIDVTGTLSSVTITGATVTFTDTDDPVSFSIADAEATEGGKVTFTVSRAGAEDNVASVKIATAADSGDDVNAASTSDYTAIATAQTLNFAKGVTSQMVEIQTTQDDLFEPDETFLVNLSAPALADGDPGTGVSIEEGKGTATGTIKNDDTEPSFAVADANASEGNAITFTVTRSGAMDNAVSVKWNTKAATGAGTASTTDYTPVTTAQTLSFAKGVSSQTFTVSTTEDVLAEGNETFLVELTGAVGGTISTAEATGTINDDDAAPTGITLSVDTNGAEDGTPSTVAEDAGATVVTVTATVNGTTRYVDAKTVVVSVADGTAASPADYAAVSNFNITIAAGGASQSGSFTVTPVDDDLDESNETIDVTGTLSSVTITGATVTFTDTDDPVSFSIADAEATEGGKVTFTVSRAGAEDNVASVKIATAADSGDDVNAASTSDYTAIATAQTLNFAKGVTSQTVEVQTTQDDLFEPDETFKAVLSAPALADGDPGTGVSIESGKGTATGTITNDDTEPSFAVADASASEGDAITFTVTRSGAMDNVVSVKWNTKADSSDGANAASASDYTAVTAARPLTFAKGAATQTFTVATTEDNLDEDDETFLVELTEAVGGTITDAEATGTITDDDDAPSGITLSVDTNGSTAGTPSTVAEDAGATVVTVTATVNGTTRYVEAQTVEVSVADGTAASPADYAAVSNFNITIAAGGASQSGSFTVTPVDDDLDESNETIDVTGTLSSVTITGATVTFTDTDDPVSFSIADAEATEGGKVTFTVSRAGAEDNVASVKIATAADSGDDVNAASTSDYTAIATAQTLNFAKGVTSQTVEVQTTQDDLFEPDETFKAVLSAPALADGDPGTGVSIESGKGTATGTITNDDTEPSFAVADASASEGDAITFTVTRSGAMDNVVSVKWNTKADSSDGANAASASDYTAVTAARPLTFAKGAATQTFTVATTEDNLDEDDETFLVELTEPAGGTIATAEATGTINDDDAAPTGITLTVSPATVGEGAGETEITVTATVNGTTRYVDAKTVTVSVGGGTAISGTDYVAVANFDITIAAGDASKIGTFDLTPKQDELHEGSETINLDGTLTGVTVTDAMITLTDDDGQPSFAVADASANEGDAITFTVTRSGAMDNAVSVKWNTKADSSDGANAASTSDYTAMTTATKLDFVKGAGTQTFTVATTEDTMHEGNETFLVELTEPVGAIISDAEATGTINDDDAVPTALTLTVDTDTGTNNVQTSLAEDGDAKMVRVTATLGGNSTFNVAKTVAVEVGADGDGATEGTDYANVGTQTITINAGSLSGYVDFTLTPTDDDIDEPDEGISIEGTLASVTVTGTSLTITDDEATPTVTLVLTPATINESGETNASTVTATLSGESSAPVTVTVSVSNDAPVTLSTNTTLTIAAGSKASTGAVTITAVDNDVDAPNASVVVSGVASGGGVAVANPDNQTLTVTDDEATPTVTLVLTPATINESGETNASTVTATLSGESSAPVTVTVSVSNDAPVTLSTNTTLTIAAGSKASTGAVTITAVDNDVDAPNASVVVSGVASGGGVAVANPDNQTLTVTDDEATPTVTLVLTPATINENGNGNASTVTATLSGKSNEDVTLTVAAAAGADTTASDFALSTTTTLTIAAGATTSTGAVTITAVDNDIDAPNKTVTVSATASGGDVANPTNQTLTINDDEGLPTATLVLTPTMINESGNGNASTVTATLSGKSNTAVTLTVAAAAGADTDAGDFTVSANKTLSIEAGATTSTGAVTITAVDNNVDAPNKTVTVSATASGGGVANPTNQTLTINDDDVAPSGITLTANPDSVTENGGAKTITVTAAVNGATRYAQARTVSVSVGGGTAISGTDYTAVESFDITIGAGEDDANNTFTLTPTNDVLAEGSETIDVTGTLSGITITPDEITLTDDDAAPSGITLSVDTNGAEDGTPDTVAEDAGATVVTVTATVNGTTRYVDAKTVAVSVDDNTAASPADYAAVSGFNITIAAGAASHTGSFTVTPVDDDLDESNETIDVTGTLSSVTITGATVTFTDNDDPLSFSIADAEATEGGKVVFTVSRAGAEDNVASVKVTTATDSGDDANAADADDYTAIATAQTLNFAKDITSQTVEVQTTEDDLFEPDETFKAVLSEPALADGDPGTGVSIESGKGTATGTIKNDDTEPSFAVADANASEGDGITFTVTRSGAMDNAVSVKWNTKAASGDGAAEATDYTPETTAQTLTFAKGVGTQTFTVATTEDVLAEGNETFLVELTGAVGGTITTAQATGTINDDDDAPSGITLTVSPATVGEGAGETEVTVTATVNGTTRYVDAKTVVVSVGGGTATSGTDYDAVSNFDIIIAAGDASKTGTFDLTPTQDDLHEGSETINVSGTSDSLTITPATVTINDDDGQPSFAVADASANEGDTITFTVTRSGAMDNAVSVKWNTKAATGAGAASTSDYTAMTTATKLDFAMGVGSQTFTVATTEDSLHEGDETFLVELTEPVGAIISDAEATGTITDDDVMPSTLTLSVDADTGTNNVQTSLAEDGGAKMVRVTASLGGSSTFNVAKTVAVEVGADADGATEGTDYTNVGTQNITINAGASSGYVDFQLTPTNDDIDEPDEGISVEGTLASVTVTGTSLTITDDEGTPTVTLVLTPSTINESGDTNSSTVTATLSGKSSVAVTLTVAAAAGADTASGDFTVTANKTLTIAEGATTSTGAVTITAVDNDVDAPNNTVTVSATASGGGVANPGNQTLTITDDEGIPTATLMLTPSTINESGGTNSSTVTATLSGKSNTAVTLTVAAAAGADTASGDFTVTANKTLTIAAGTITSTGAVTITAVDNDVDAPNKTVTVSATASGGGVANPGDQTLTITDDEGTPTVTLVLTPSTINESGNGNASTVTATLSGESSAAVTVEVSVPNNAPVTVSGNTTLTIAAGSKASTGTVTITAVDNDVDAANASVLVSGVAAGGSVTNPGDQTLTITDDEGTPTVTLVLTPSTINESGGTNSSTVTATLSGKSSVAVTLTVAAAAGADTASGDFTVTANKTLTIAAGATTSTGAVAITAVDNDIDAPNKTVTVSATASGGGVANPGNQTLTITDDEGTPTVTLVLTPSTINESGNGNASTVTATLSGESSAPLTITVSVPNDAPVTLSTNTTLTIAAGAKASTGAVTITAVDNDVDAPNKTVTVSATASGGGVAKPNDQTLTINDDEGAPTVTLVLTPSTINESGATNSSTVTATLSGKSNEAVTLTVAAAAGADTAASDFAVSANKTLTIAAGATTSTGAVTITAVNNDIDAPNKTVTVSATASGGGVAKPNDQTLTINDDEGVPTATLVLTPTTINESGGTNSSTVTATLSGKSNEAVTLTVAAAAGADTAAADFAVSANKTLTIAAGATTSTGAVTITAVDNDVDAPNKTVTVSATASGGGVANPDNQTLTINDDEGVPTATLVLTPTAIDESGGTNSSTVTATLSGKSNEAVTLTVAVAAGADTAAADFTVSNNKTLTIAAGATTSTGAVTITAVDNNVDAPNKTVTVSATASGGGVGDPANQTLTITDDDVTPSTLTLSVDTDTSTNNVQTTLAEDGGAKMVRVTATLGGSTFTEAKMVTLEVGADADSAEKGTDYTTVEQQSITINAGAASGYVDFKLTPTDDTLHEGSETISLEGTLADVTVTDATITLTDDDATPSGITLSVSPVTVEEGAGETEITVTATVNGTTRYVDAKTVVVSVGGGTATSGTDYDAVSNFDIIIAAGDASKTGTFDLTPTQDDLHEGSETINVSGTSDSLTITPATVTINDDDGQPSFAVADASANEGDTITFTVTRSGAMDNAVSVKWNTKAATGAGAASTSDYTAMTTATKLDFAMGVGSQTFTVATTEDSLHEGDETFLVELTEPVGAIISDAEATGTITDDDAIPTALTLSVDADTDTNNVQTSLAEDGGAKMVRVTASLGGSSTFNVAKTVAVEVGADADGATEGTDYTNVGTQNITINAGASSGYVEFTLTPTDDDIDEPDEGISIEGTLASVTVTGTSLTITDDEATPTVTLVLTPATINESGETNASTVTAMLSGESSAPVTVTVSVPNDAPVTLSSNTILKIAAGAKASTGTVTITAVDNNVDAPNETVTVSAAARGGVAIPVIETLTINDDDVAPTGITLSVSPATVREKDGETEITVTATVNGTTRYADAKTVTVSVGDGTATSGMDYDAVSNFDIIIAAGDTSSTGTFDLMLINDAVQEKDETIEITGSSGALNITKAMITITNSDPMPAAWLGRFGRTVAEQALDGIAGRIAASRSAGVQGSIAGHALNFDSPYSGSEALPRLDPRAGAGGTGVESITTNDTTTLNNLVNNNVLERSELTLTSGDSGIDAFDTDGQTSRSYTMTARELLLGSSFTATGEKDVSGGSLASWGRTAQSSFDGREGTLSLDGEATTTMLGVDYARDHWLVGMALMQSNGKGGYQDSETELRAASPACSTTENGTEQGTCNGAVRDGEGEVEATLTAVTPYAAIQTSENLKLWGTLGHGTGEVTLTPAVGDPLKADISWTMAAVGLRSDIIVPRKNSTELGPLSDSGLALALTADALWARTSSNRTQDMVASDSDVTRLRFGLEGSYQITLKQGGSVTPRLELGVRQDGGSAETGLGIELVGGLSWLDPTLGLSIDLSGRTLIVHSSDDLKNQSFAVAFAWDPDPATQRGPSLKFSQQWGTIALGGLDTPFGPDSIEDLGDSENTARWQADAAWGFPIFGGSFTGSPHVGVGLASDTRDYSLGWRLTPAANANAPDLSFAVKATRQESDTAPPEHSIGFVLIFRW